MQLKLNMAETVQLYQYVQRALPHARAEDAAVLRSLAAKLDDAFRALDELHEEMDY